jgi:peroxiredoxin Q/BCP
MLSWLFSKPLPVGTQAPDFSTTDQSGNSVKLSALKGRNVVLVFYPADETSVCTRQLCEFRDAWADVRAKNAVVFGVNPANSFKHGKFRDLHEFPFPLLVDKGQKVAKLYNASGPVPKRSVYLIGPDGVIRFSRRGKPVPAEVLASAA